MNECAIKPRVRKMTIADLDECFEKGVPRFQKWFPHMDHKAMKEACAANIDEMGVLLIRTNNAFGCATVDSTMQEPRLWVKEEWVFGPVWEATSIFREMMEWGKRIGAFRFSFGSVTEYDVKPIAKYLGEFSVIEAYTFNLEPNRP